MRLSAYGARPVELAHVAQNADDPDDLAIGIAQRGGVKAGPNRIA
jgi:hypothetical protein